MKSRRKTATAKNNYRSMKLGTTFNEEKVTRQLIERGYGKEAIESLMHWYCRDRFAASFITDKNEQPWQVREYQMKSLLSRAPRKVHRDGRDVGKTTEIEIISAWAALMCPNSEMLIATQCENHLFPLMNRIVRRFNASPRFKTAVVEMKRSTSWFLRFSNGFVLWGRIAGPRGMNFQGMHVDWQIVDEAQEMTETAWAELYQSLNGDGCRWVYGVPNGLRNTFYRMTEMKDVDLHEWPSTKNPEFTQKKDDELALLYGGRKSPGYIHRVLGLHGEPAHSVFRLDDYLSCVDESLEFRDVHVEEEDDFEPPSDVASGNYYMGCDLGYARDPSELVVYRLEGPHIINVMRVHMEGVNYAKQQDIIVQLDNAYNFRSIGIDCGNSGRALAHNLMVLGHTWCQKIKGFEFGGVVELEPFPDGSPQKRRVKRLMTDLLVQRMSEGTIIYPRLGDREVQYASHTYTVGANGGIVYDKGNDHIIDADRCAILAHYLDTREIWTPPSVGVRLEGFD